MGDPSKHLQNNNFVSDLKALFPVQKTRKTKIFVYGFMFAFIACTAFLAFNSSGSASPWFNSLFNSYSTSAASSYRSQVSSIFSYIFPNSSITASAGASVSGVRVDDGKKDGILGRNQTTGSGVSEKDKGKSVGGLAKNQTEKAVPVKDQGKESVATEKGAVLEGKNQTGNGGQAKTQTTNEVIAKTQTDNAVSAKNQTGNAVPAKNQAGNAVPAKNQAGNVVPAKNQAVNVVPGKNQTKEGSGSKKDGVLDGKNQSKTGVSDKNSTGSGVTASKNTSKQSGVSGSNKNNTKVDSKGNVALTKNETAPKKSGNSTINVMKGVPSGAAVVNLTASLKKGNGSSSLSSNGNADKKGDDWIKSMIGCDIFQGRWVKDDSYPLYPEGSCPHIDEPFDCYLNGRPDRSYQKLRWQPNGCNIPRLNATDMLERLRGKRLVFVGDSLNRNMWESLVCVLRNSVKDKNKVFEMSGRREFRTEGSYSFLFKDYGCTIEFFRSPFLVQEWEVPDNHGHKKETLRLDTIEKSSSKYKDAYAIIFNTGHWWTHEKTSKGKDYYQEGNRVYGELKVIEAFHKALNTWAKWVDTNVNPKKTLVFFRGYSASHFSGGRWNSGGACDRETEPIKNETYLAPYPPKMGVLETVLKEMKTPVTYLNITRITDYRKDAHPSIYRKQNLTDEERRAPERYQDCSHWCLPGVPDTWNELLYAQLLIKQYQQKH
ncbi:PC-Esterase protein [Dioscorea alata]|uniref:PC-Esterase protein n=2 Tax=Dioscorea alata TaxID=55571 RepID=A0ACB7U787_DIOAL|nr:PC-Esterase protein [Dioscorea alata]KAH7656158.1 PC-Esterase protein [Dioscorea alata]